MHCPNCETLNRDGAHFCDECGFPLDGVKDTSAPEVPEAVDEGGDQSEPVEDAAVDSGCDDTVVVDNDLSVPCYGKPLDRTPAPVNETVRDESQDQGTSLIDEAKTQRLYEDATQRIDATMELPRIDQQQPVENRDYRLVNEVPKRGKAKRVIIALVIIALIAGIAAGVTYALGLWGGVVVPEVIGKEQAEAVASLEELGFEVRTMQVKSDETEGVVLLTDPEGGARVPKGSEVVVHLATTRTVPEIVGMTKEQAEALLNDEGYTLITYETEKSDGDENIVLSVNPEAGARAKSTTDIFVTLSEAYRVPNVNGLDAETAQSTVTDEGLTPDIVYIDTDQFPDGSVINVQPEPGTKLAGGDYVTLSVARARGIQLVALTESLLSKGSTVTLGGVSYEIESLISANYIGNDAVAFTATGRPKITFFGETLYASTSQTIAGTVVWSPSNEVVSIS